MTVKMVEKQLEIYKKLQDTKRGNSLTPKQAFIASKQAMDTTKGNANQST